MKLAFLFLFLVLATEVNATGIGVVPGRLDFELQKGDKLEKSLSVYNLGSEVIEFEVTSPADYLRFYHKGIVDGNGSRKVIVEAITGNLDAGVHNTEIYVTTTNKETGIKFSIGTVVKAKVTVIKSSGADRIAGVLVSLTVFGIGMFFYFAFTRLGRFFQQKKREAFL